MKHGSDDLRGPGEGIWLSRSGQPALSVEDCKSFRIFRPL